MCGGGWMSARARACVSVCVYVCVCICMCVCECVFFCLIDCSFDVLCTSNYINELLLPQNIEEEMD